MRTGITVKSMSLSDILPLSLRHEIGRVTKIPAVIEREEKKKRIPYRVGGILKGKQYFLGED